MKKIILFIFLYIWSSNSFAQFMPFIEDFESITFPPTGWSLNPTGSPSWVLDSTVSAYEIGNACISFDNFTNTTGAFDIRLPQLNMSQALLPFIRFDVAYAMQPTTVTSDEIGIWWSPNNTTWQNLQNYSGNLLATAAPVSTPFIPVASDWRTTFFPLTWVTGQAHVYLQLENNCHGGNKIFIDNIRVFDSATVDIQEPDGENLFSVYPNPANDLILLNFLNINNGSDLKVFNSSGKLIIEKHIDSEIKEINCSEWPDGIYYFKVNSGANYVGKKVVKTCSR